MHSGTVYVSHWGYALKGGKLLGHDVEAGYCVLAAGVLSS
jgi:hypothetical protein